MEKWQEHLKDKDSRASGGIAEDVVGCRASVPASVPSGLPAPLSSSIAVVSLPNEHAHTSTAQVGSPMTVTTVTNWQGPVTVTNVNVVPSPVTVTTFSTVQSPETIRQSLEGAPKVAGPVAESAASLEYSPQESISAASAHVRAASSMRLFMGCLLYTSDAADDP